MDKVVILARVSTDRQEYRRQINELKSFCQKMDWDIAGTFANKVSGAESFENRTELRDMIEFVRSNDVKRVVCLKISRLGCNTLEALKVIQILNENKVSLYIPLRVSFVLYCWRSLRWNDLPSESAWTAVGLSTLRSAGRKVLRWDDRRHIRRIRTHTDFNIRKR